MPLQLGMFAQGAGWTSLSISASSPKFPRKTEYRVSRRKKREHSASLTVTKLKDFVAGVND